MECNKFVEPTAYSPAPLYDHLVRSAETAESLLRGTDLIVIFRAGRRREAKPSRLFADARAMRTCFAWPEAASAGTPSHVPRCFKTTPGMRRHLDDADAASWDNERQ
jgi:hypothetical protein